jgi:putative endonuclease
MCDDVLVRVSQHKAGKGSVFTAKYKCHYLMRYEEFHGIRYTIDREKQLKRWHREWKINLIREDNPDMKDLADDWY